jgi:hypothetical protein
MRWFHKVRGNISRTVNCHRLPKPRNSASKLVYTQYQEDIELLAVQTRKNRPPNLGKLIVPKFWTGFPALQEPQYAIDCSQFQVKTDVLNSKSEFCKKVRKRFDDVGLVHLKNTGLDDDLPTMQLCAQIPMDGVTYYEGGANSRNQIIGNVFDTGAPSGSWLQYHHEMAYIKKSVKMLGFCAMQVCHTRGKGAIFVSDNIAVTRAILRTPFGQKLKEKGICYIRCLTDRDAHVHLNNTVGIYNHWQQSFLTNCSDVAESRAIKNGLQVDWGPGRFMRTKFYTSAFEYMPELDQNLLYASVADHDTWFDTWPGMNHLARMLSYDVCKPEDRPLRITFGDDSEMTQDELEVFAKVYDNYGTPINCDRGDVVIVCNYRFAHGRPNYSLEEGEQRQLGVVLGDIFDRVGQR